MRTPYELGFWCGESRLGTVDDCPFNGREKAKRRMWLRGFLAGGDKYIRKIKETPGLTKTVEVEG